VIGPKAGQPAAHPFNRWLLRMFKGSHGPDTQKKSETPWWKFFDARRQPGVAFLNASIGPESPHGEGSSPGLEHASSKCL
jgi:hypothetical protein